MPGARMKGKQKVGFWFTKPEIELLKEIADDVGLTMSDVIRALLAEHAKRLVKRARAVKTDDTDVNEGQKGETK